MAHELVKVPANTGSELVFLCASPLIRELAWLREHAQHVATRLPGARRWLVSSDHHRPLPFPRAGSGWFLCPASRKEHRDYHELPLTEPDGEVTQ